MDYNPGVSKRQKLLPPPPRYLCIICSAFCGQGWGDRRVYDLFMLNLTSDFQGAPIRLRLDPGPGSFHVYAFCVLNSTLYIFQDCPLDRLQSGDWSTKTSVFTLDLSLCVSAAECINGAESPIRVCSIGHMDKARDMMYPKCAPAALPTPDGKKIVVFSRIIKYDPQGKLINFELYDSTAESWEQLPGICDDWKHRVMFSIQSWVFLSNSILLVDTGIGIFSLDIDNVHTGWERRSFCGGCQRFPLLHPSKYKFEDFRCQPTISIPLYFPVHFPFYGHAFVGKGGELLLSSFGAFDIREEDGFFTQFHLELSPPPSDVDRPVPTLKYAITLLDDVDNGQCNFCIVQGGLNKTTGYPYLIIDECSIDVKDKEKAGEDKKEGCSIDVKDKGEAGEDKKEVLETVRLSSHINKCMKFSFTDQRYSSFCPLGVFSICTSS